MADENKAPAPGTPEHDAAMAAKMDESAKAARVAAGLEQPAEEPKKEDPAQGTEQKPAEEPPKEGTEQKQEEKPAEEPEKKQEEAPKEPMTDFSAFEAEYAEKGELSEESYKALADAGYAKGLVDNYIEGQKAIAAQRSYMAYDAAGGQENFAQMQEWAKDGMSKAEIEAFNTAVEGSPEEMLQAVRGLRSRFEAEYGRDPKLLGGRPAGAVQGFESRAQMVAAMRDPRYSKDPAFRAQVERKAALSNF